MSETRKLVESIQANLKEDDKKMLSGDETYVSKNQFNYSILGLIIDNKNRKFQFVNGQTMPLNKHKRLTGKALRNKAKELKNQGYEEYKGYGSMSLDEDTVVSDNSFSGVEFEKNLPHEMRFKEYDVLEDEYADGYNKALYWVTQQFFGPEDIKQFQEALKNTDFDAAFVTVRDLSTYEYPKDKNNNVIVTITTETFDDSGYKENIENDYGEEGLIYAGYKTSMKESTLNESGTNLDIDLNTGVLPIVNVDLYSLSDRLPDSASYEELDEIIKDIAPKYIEETIQEVLPSAKITANKVYHPKQYNYSGDELEFNLTVNQDEYENLRKEALSNNEFENFLKSNYSSSSGFISTMPDSIEAFNRSKTWQSMVQVIMFALRNTDLDSVNDNYLDEFMEEIN